MGDHKSTGQKTTFQKVAKTLRTNVRQANILNCSFQKMQTELDLADQAEKDQDSYVSKTKNAKVVLLDEIQRVLYSEKEGKDCMAEIMMIVKPLHEELKRGDKNRKDTVWHTGFMSDLQNPQIEAKDESYKSFVCDLSDASCRCEKAQKFYALHFEDLEILQQDCCNAATGRSSPSRSNLDVSGRSSPKTQELACADLQGRPIPDAKPDDSSWLDVSSDEGEESGSLAPRHKPTTTGTESSSIQRYSANGAKCLPRPTPATSAQTSGRSSPEGAGLRCTMSSDATEVPVQACPGCSNVIEASAQGCLGPIAPSPEVMGYDSSGPCHGDGSEMSHEVSADESQLSLAVAAIACNGLDIEEKDGESKQTMHNTLSIKRQSRDTMHMGVASIGLGSGNRSARRRETHKINHGNEDGRRPRLFTSGTEMFKEHMHKMHAAIISVREAQENFNSILVKAFEKENCEESDSVSVRLATLYPTEALAEKLVAVVKGLPEEFQTIVEEESTSKSAAEFHAEKAAGEDPRLTEFAMSGAASSPPQKLPEAQDFHGHAFKTRRSSTIESRRISVKDEHAQPELELCLKAASIHKEGADFIQTSSTASRNAERTSQQRRVPMPAHPGLALHSPIMEVSGKNARALIGIDQRCTDESQEAKVAPSQLPQDHSVAASLQNNVSVTLDDSSGWFVYIYAKSCPLAVPPS
jgi:hypothetical protein